MRDLLNNLESGVSISETAEAGTIAGAYVDMLAADGEIYCLSLLGDPSADLDSSDGEEDLPSAMSAVTTLYEADTSGGSGAQAIVSVSGTTTLTTAKSKGWIRALRTKRYVQARTVLTLTGGTVPKAPISSVVMGQKKIVT